jgi:hypothetical protein
LKNATLEKHSSESARPTVSQVLYDLYGTPENKSVWAVRRKILPLRRRLIDTIIILLTRNRNSPDWELVQDVAKSRSSQQIDGAFFNYNTHPQRPSGLTDLVLGRPSFGRTLKFYRRLKGDWSAKQSEKAAAPAQQT